MQRKGDDMNLASILKQAGTMAGSATKNVLPTQQKATTPKVTKPKTTTSGLGSIGNMVGTMTGNALNAITPSTINQGNQFAQVPQVTPQPLQQSQQNYDAQIKSLIDSLGKVSQPTIQPYQSQYSDDIGQLLSAYNNRQPFSFDATNNPAILAQQKKAGEAVTQEMARRNILNSSITGNQMADRIAEVYATMAPQLEQQAYSQWDNQGNNILQQLQLLQGLDTQGYNKYMDSTKLGLDQQNNAKSDIYSMIDVLNKLGTQDYNKTQDAQNMAIKESGLTGYYNPYAGTQISPEVQQYAGDFQAEINRRRATPDTSDDALIPQIEAARANKVFSSPDMLNKYGEQFKTAEQKAYDLSNQIAQQQAELEADPNSYANQKKILELQKMKEEVSLLYTYGPQEQQAKIKQFESVIARNNAAATASYAAANKSNSEASNTGAKQNLKYSDYYNDGVAMRQAGTYDDNKAYMPKYNDTDIYDWVMGLGASDEWKAQLLNDLGVPETVLDSRIKTQRYNMLK